MLQEKNSSDLYECPLCGEELPEKDKATHEAFTCRILFQDNDPLYSLFEKMISECCDIDIDIEKNAFGNWLKYEENPPTYELLRYEKSCKKISRKFCRYCNKELHTGASEAHHFSVSEVYQQNDSLPEASGINNDKKALKVKPKVGKCPYCKTVLNANILLFHQEECVYQPIKCPDCSATILLKDSSSHFCKSTDKDIEISEIDLLSEHLKELFTNENCWDTVLEVEGKEFKAHRAILSVRSSVFSAMFLHETSEKQTGIVKISDCDPGCFKEFLEYLYTGKLKNISSDNAVRLYIIADKYNVQELKMFCAKYLMQNITLQNFSEVLILADNHDESNILSAVQDFFNKYFKEIVITNGWENLLKCNFRLANKLLIGKSQTE